ncbi:MAG: PaaI family thioesterase [Bacteroidales bacterium]|nr:PaaI family thioesterase [Bacteroidales bacterium]
MPQKTSLKHLAEEVFRADRFATEMTAITIDEVELHRCHCSLALTDLHRNALGAVMGGVLFTMADFGAAIAANTECLGDGNLRWISLDSTINYLAGAKGQKLESETVCIKHGRTTALYRTTINDGDRTVAEVTSTMVCAG